ncbi:MAG TPA: valine--tRNA ligase [Usitatibacter sp.]|jgi:valyl-tRNA synthetase|nr:valine--tRNA ligase [Usitatibacter sp.]
MELAKSFDPHGIESRWYPFWESRGYFKAGFDAAKPSFSIQLPPPNVTGTLHMGHAFQQTLMDILARYHRMKGYNVLWQPGTDHAGIATQMVVERQLEAAGESRRALGREEFVKRVWQWKEKSGSTITRQMRRLGDSCDWSREYFTMDAPRSRAVTEVFVRLFEQGLIYRGKRLVNWDPVLQTAVSDLEVESKEENGSLWSLRYPLEDGSGHLVVATTRPETMLGDTAVAVHPEDERYKHLVGKRVRLPLADRLIPVVADEYVDREFGTGVVKITPAHDFNDYQLGQRHGLPMIGVLTLEARINENAPLPYQGLDRFEARKRVLADLEKLGLLEGTKQHKLMQPRSQRSDAVVEPMLSDQWFMRMDGMARQGLEAVAKNETRFVPEEWTKIYNQWLSNIQDWCISRQLWWGHQIPAWYADDGTPFVGRTFEEARAKATAAGKSITPQARDSDVLDTWFSSALVPFTTLGWPDEAQFARERAFYLPSSVLVTGFDIIFFWVARMIMTTLQFTGQTAFRDVYINAIVRDAEGQKMSKSKGNTIDPLDVIDGVSFESLLDKSTQGLMLAAHKEAAAKRIKRDYPGGIPAYGADALRFTFAALSTHGRTLNFDLKRAEGYRSFCNKLWNATRFVLMNCEGHDTGLDASKPAGMSSIDRWIVSRLQRTEKAFAEALAEYRFDTAARAVYEFVWDEYCDWYVELAKVQIANGNEAQQRGTRRTLIRVLETTLRLAHPIIPFITEELWHKVAPLAGKAGDSIMVAPFPEADASRIDEAAEREVAMLMEVVNAARTLRSTMGLAPGAKVPMYLAESAPELRAHEAGMCALARLSELRFVDALPAEDAPVSITKVGKVMLHVEIDRDAERTRLRKELEKVDAEIAKARASLGNAGFVDRAPKPVVDQMRKRLAEFEAKQADLRAQLAKLG